MRSKHWGVAGDVPSHPTTQPPSHPATRSQPVGHPSARQPASQPESPTPSCTIYTFLLGPSGNGSSQIHAFVYDLHTKGYDSSLNPALFVSW